MLKIKRLLPVAVLLLVGALHVPAAFASGGQVSIIQDDDQLKANPVSTLATFRELGVDVVRVNVAWADIAPNSGSSHKPGGFNASDPGSYPAAGWGVYDTIVRYAQADGITVDFTLTSPVPVWAEGSGQPRGGIPGVWKPSASEFGAFAHAIGIRYDGHYKPKGYAQALPRVNFWSIWNEPNYGRALAPQQVGGSSTEYSAVEYRGLLAAGWGGLLGSGHSLHSDTILIGETAPRGVDSPGDFNGWKALRFIRALYCVDSHYRQLRGSAAAARGCPTTASASRRFRAQNPALFQASGFADHPYTAQANPVAPNVPTSATGRGSDPDYADLPEVPRLEGVLDQLNRIYGSHTRFTIWDTEYGYRTRPPDHVGVSATTAAYYDNWAEYIKWRNSRIRSANQYLLVDPPSGQFASGLEYASHRPKATFDAFRLPLYLPVTSTRRGHTLEVWGCVRPAHFGGSEKVLIQFRRGSHGAFHTIQTVGLRTSRGYFDVRLAFPSSGAMRLAWSEPGVGAVYSRTQNVSVR